MKPIFYILPLLFVLACQSSPDEAAQQDGVINATGIERIDQLSAAIQQTPEKADLYAARAAAYYENEGYDEAIVDFKQALALDSMQVGYWHGLADVYMDYYRSRDGLKTMERAAELFPDRIPTLLKLSEFQLILQQHTAALKTLDQIRAMDPFNPEMFYMGGLVMQDRGDNDPAISNFQSAVENDPDMIEAWIALGKLWAVKDKKVAVHFFNNALRVDSTSLVALHEKALYQGNILNDVAAAQETFKQLIKFYPQYVDAYFNSGLLYLDMDSLDLARQQFDLAIQVEPTFVSAYYYRGITAELVGKKEEARKYFEQALKLDPDNAELEEALGRVR